MYSEFRVHTFRDVRRSLTLDLGAPECVILDCWWWENTSDGGPGSSSRSEPPPLTNTPCK